MHNIIRIILKDCIIIVFASLAIASCSRFGDTIESNRTDSIKVSAYASDFICADTYSRVTISPDCTFSWSQGDVIGVYSNDLNSTYQTPSHISFVLSSTQGSVFAFSYTTGWNLINTKQYKYAAYYPYDENDSRDRIELDYSSQLQSSNASLADVGQFDYMYSDPTFPSSDNEVSFSFHHIGSLANFVLDVPEEYKDSTFYRLSLNAEDAIFSSTAWYSFSSLFADGEPELNRNDVNRLYLSFGEDGITPINGQVSAWMMMLPSEWKDKSIKVKLFATRTPVPDLEGSFTPTTNQVAGVKYSYDISTSKTNQILPDKPGKGETLHILLFGHSFGIDCTAYLPSIVNAAGISNVHWGRWYHSSAFLSTHWNHIVKGDTYDYADSPAGSSSWKTKQRKVEDVMRETAWDIVLFQDGVGYGGEGEYSHYKPYLDTLVNYVNTVSYLYHKKHPAIGWNMFWSQNSGNQTDYDRNCTDMYHAIVNATQEMMADTGIKIVIPVGTAVQNARDTSLNDWGSPTSPSTTKLLTRDGCHASNGIGCYTSACTWFQYLITPMYGIGITGNTYRPTYTSFEKDLVTDDRAAICWKCAIEAVKHPFEVTPIVE